MVEAVLVMLLVLVAVLLVAGLLWVSTPKDPQTGRRPRWWSGDGTSDTGFGT